MTKNLLSQHVAPEMEVWAYGNRVTHKAHDGSDLDLVVLNPANPKKPQENLMELRDAFNESDLPILVDILHWARIPESLIIRILATCSTLCPIANE
jgi:uncharacterized protein